ncbi:hypothetical protein T09_7068, partial [Trichinella sp. T9]
MWRSAQQPSTKIDLKEDPIHTQERTRCPLCQKFHDISACTQFLTSDVDERWRIAKRLGLCHSCLKKGHRKIECR